MLDINDLKRIGTIIKFNGEPYEVIYSQHTHMGRGGASLRTKLKNLISGQVLERVFSPGDKIEEADIEKSKASFLYATADKLFFMDTNTFEQFFLEKKVVSGKEKFLKEGLEIEVLLFEKKPVSIQLPPKVVLKVIEAPPAVKGDSATTPTKTVTLETGMKINVPIFIKEGDSLLINTETGEYVSRV